MQTTKLAKQMPTQKSDAVPEGYILVKNPKTGGDEKSGDPLSKSGEAQGVDSVTSSKILMSPSFKAALSAGKRQGNVIQVRLVGSYTITSAAATALTQVQALSPIAISDWSSFAAVYDLARVKGVLVHYRMTASAAVTGAADFGVAFDPSNLGAYSSVSDVMTAKHHHGPGVVGATTTFGCLPTGRTGFFKIGPIRLEQQRVTNDGTAAAAIGGGWFGTSDTTAVVGWLKPFCASLGGALTSTIVYYVVYDVEFKSRT
jgi:hypothetical protein